VTFEGQSLPDIVLLVAYLTGTFLLGHDTTNEIVQRASGPPQSGLVVHRNMTVYT
jgi:hypothetical protein